MLLGADRIGFPQPGPEVLVDLARRHEPKVMHVISGRDGIDAAKSRVRETAGKDDVSVEPCRTRCDLGKRHTNLKCDPGLFRDHGHRSALGDSASHRVEQHPYSGILPLKMMLQVVPSAGVRLIAVGETPATPGALPQRGASHRPQFLIDALSH